MTRILRVCVTGPECTGKTTLSRRLAAALDGEWAPEGARSYAERVRRELTAEDVMPIAREQMGHADEALARATDGRRALVVSDTDLLSTMIYARHYYDVAPAALVRAERQRRADLYLLCDADVPWVSDGIRDAGSDRDAMYAEFASALAKRKVPVVHIGGGWNERFASARAAVAAALAEAGTTVAR